MIRVLFWLFLLTIFVISPFFGSVSLSLSEILQPHSLSHDIFLNLRLPRELFSFTAGAVLALSGLLFQTLFRNALMTPYTLGISSGAVLGVGIAIKLGVAMLALFGFSGALVSVFVLLFVSRFVPHTQHNTLLLLGIALSMFYTSALTIVFYLGSSIQNDMLLRFTMGSLSILGWRDPFVLLGAGVLLLLTAYRYRFELQLLSVSEQSAKLKGVNTQRVTTILLVAASLAIGVLVSIAGPIGFVGLVAPHIVAKIYPVSVEKRLGITALFGGVFLIACDTLARIINTQSELPIGIITALIGGPFFIYLLLSKKNA